MINDGGQKLQTKMQGQMFLSQKMIQSIKMLQLPYPEFIQKLRKEIAKNPLLKTKKVNVEISRESLDSFENNQDKKNNSVYDILSESHSEKKNLFHVLKEQLDMFFAKDSFEFELGLIAISSLDEKGFFLEEKKKEIIREKKCDVEILEKVLERIKKFHPTGVGSASVQECLLAQLLEMEQEKNISFSVEKEMIEHHFAMLNQEESIIKKMKIDKKTFREAKKRISYLNPNPAVDYVSFQTQLVIPEVKVEIIEENKNQKLKIMIKENIYPKIKIEEKIKTENDQKKINQYKNEAQKIVDTIEYRKSNLQKIVEIIVEKQRDFFLGKGGKIIPQTITQMAKKINIDTSIASRLVNKKFVETPLGIFPLRMFFNTATIEQIQKKDSQSIKEKVTAEHIQNVMKKTIAERGNLGISDQKLCEILQQQGYKIARRTVNKYRRALDKNKPFNE